MRLRRRGYDGRRLTLGDAAAHSLAGHMRGASRRHSFSPRQSRFRRRLQYWAGVVFLTVLGLFVIVVLAALVYLAFVYLTMGD